jgi:hypothetical protein
VFAQLTDEQLATADALVGCGVPRARASLELTRRTPEADPANKSWPEPRVEPEHTTIWNVRLRAEEAIRGPDPERIFQGTVLVSGSQPLGAFDKPIELPLKAAERRAPWSASSELGCG